LVGSYASSGAPRHDTIGLTVSDFLIPLTAFFIGVFFAPVVRPLLRPLFVELIRAGLMTVDETRRLTAQVRENIDDATAEVQAEREAAAKAAGRRPGAQAAPGDVPPVPSSTT
jgi:hypothetical protein